ncbi:hypothetical protein Tco_1517323 [Tanacetum coccineum]
MECIQKTQPSNTRGDSFYMRKKFTSRKLNCGYQWRPTGKKFSLGELCPLTRLPVTCGTDHPLVSGLKAGIQQLDLERIDGSLVDDQWLTLSADLLRKALNIVTPADTLTYSSHLQLENGHKPSQEEEFPFKLVDEDEFNRS